MREPRTDLRLRDVQTVPTSKTEGYVKLRFSPGQAVALVFVDDERTDR